MKKIILISFASCAILATSASAANMATGGDIGNTTVGGGNYWHAGIGIGNITTNINNGVTLTIKDPGHVTMVQQNQSGTSTININAGGKLDASNVEVDDDVISGGSWFHFANNVDGAVGIINVNGGTLDGSGFTKVVFGRDGGDGILNISNGGAVTFSVTPTMSNDANSTGVINFIGSNAGSYTVAGADKAYYKALFTNGELQRNGSSNGNFSDYFSVTGSTLTVIPEPPSGALLGLGGFTIIWPATSNP
jgi:hypothetical protein